MRRLLLLIPLGVVLLVAAATFRQKSITPAAPPSSLAGVDDDGSRLPDEAAMERLVKSDPVAFLRECLRRYDREVKGYTCVLHKRERLEGKLQSGESIDAKFREEPFSVLLTWPHGGGPAKAVLYVQGENDGQMLVRPAGLASLVGIVRRDPNGPAARKSGRYPLTEFGIKIGMERTLGPWEAAAKRGTLHVACLGERRVPEAGDRLCWVLHRTGYEKPEEDGVTDFTTFFDKETWLQVGSVLKGAHGQLIGEYYFGDIHLNPRFPPGTFTRKSL